MFCARSEIALAVSFVVASAVGGTAAVPAAPRPRLPVLLVGGDAVEPAAAIEVMRRADRYRGVAGPHRFLARIVSGGRGDGDRPALARPTASVVEVRSNGFARQLVFVREPTPGDVMLVTPDVVWLRPRRLHRLTRLPPDLRMLNGASVCDVTSVDLIGAYDASMRPDAGEPDAYVLDLVASREGVRYPRARYAVARADDKPLRIDFMTASGRTMKTVVYAAFESVLDATVVTRLIVEDHVFGDTAVVEMTDFAPLSAVDPEMFSPDYLLTLPSDAS
jgi:hypothetical protein